MPLALPFMKKSGKTLILPNRMAVSTGFSRSSSKWGTVSGVLTEFGSNVPVYPDPNMWLSTEGQATNYIRNPRHEGAVAGTPGTAPTYGSVITVAGITSSIVGTGTESGYPYIDIEWSGTSSAAGYIGYQPEPNSGGISASQGQTWTISSMLRIVSGSLTNISNTRFRLQERLPSAGVATDVLFTPTSVMQSVIATRTLTDPSVVNVIAAVLFQVSNGAAVNLRARFYYFGAEQSAFASSPIYPPAGTPAQSTRSADFLTFTLPGAGLLAGQGTVLFSGSLPQVAPTGRILGLFGLDDGTSNNRIVLRNVSTTVGQVNIGRSVGGSLTSSSSVGTVTAATPFAAGLTYSAGQIQAVVAGGSVVTLSGAIPTVNRLIVGHSNANALEGMFGLVRQVSTVPYAVSAAQLQTLVGRMALT